MLRPGKPSEFLPFLASASRDHRSRLARQQAGSDCFAFEHEGQIVAYGGFWPEAGYLECWFCVTPSLRAARPLRALLKALASELALRSILEARGRPMIAHVAKGHRPGERMAWMLGFDNGGPSPLLSDVNLWVYPAIQSPENAMNADA